MSGGEAVVKIKAMINGWSILKFGCTANAHDDVTCVDEALIGEHVASATARRCR